MIYKYPTDLVADIMQGFVEHGDLALFPAPAEETITAALETIFQASLIPEEGRYVSFRIVVGSRDEIGHTVGLKYLNFETPIKLSPATLAKLAPAVDSSQSLIAVSPNRDGEMLIWGIVDFGGDYRRLRAGEAASAPCPPASLILRARKPGIIDAEIGSELIASLDCGAILKPLPRLHNIRHIRTYLENVALQLGGERRGEHNPTSNPSPEELTRNGLILLLNFFSRLLQLIQGSGRGGTFLIVPEGTSKEVILKYVDIKHQVSDDVAWQTLVEVNDDDLPRIADMARLYSSLARVDGAVLMTNKLGLLGFGCKIHATGYADDPLNMQTDPPTKIALTSAGTRHRSALQFVAKLEGSLALVISQDGFIRCIMNSGGTIKYWPLIAAT